MYDCPEVASFPKGGLPTNLKGLSISYCDKLESKVMLEQSLDALTCLEALRIEVGGGMDDVNSFPHESLLLPTSLTSPQIGGFQNLKSISSGIQTLTSLQELSIADCPRLQSLPSVGFPHSLGRLDIQGCPILEKQCTKGEGVFWPLVASIPLCKIHFKRSVRLENFLSSGPEPERLRKNIYDLTIMKKFRSTMEEKYRLSETSNACRIM